MVTKLQYPTTNQSDAKKEKLNIKKVLGQFDLRAYTMIFALIFIWILFGTLNETFLTARNLSNLFTQMSVTAILAIGMVLIIVAGHIDLSIGSIVGFAGGISAILSTWMDVPFLFVVLGTLAVGAAIGLLQGWLVAYKAIPAFIVTLGGMMFFRGALLGVTNSTTIPISDEAYRMIANAYFTPQFGYILGGVAMISVMIAIFLKRKARIHYGADVNPISFDVTKAVFGALLIGVFVQLMNAYKGIPFPIIFVIVLALLFTYIATQTVFGRHIYAIGGNSEAARLSGISIRSKTMLIFVLSGLLSAIAALILTSRLSSATISAGQSYELDAIAACVIGGTSLMGGTGTIFGALVGALVMASLDNGMSLLGMESFWQYMVKGFILVVAVWLDIASQKRKA